MPSKKPTPPSASRKASPLPETACLLESSSTPWLFTLLRVAGAMEQYYVAWSVSISAARMDVIGTILHDVALAHYAIYTAASSPASVGAQQLLLSVSHPR
eukprot:2404831-Amphidinium_carterae.1